MDDRTYRMRVARTFRAIEDALEDVDPDVIDLTATGDVLTLHLPKGLRCVINTQGATKQIWMACKDSAWHFAWDDATRAWLDDKGRGVELFAKLGELVKAHAGLDATFAPASEI